MCVLHILFAKSLSARQLILLRISFCVSMYVCPSRLGMLISVPGSALKVLRMHVAALLYDLWPTLTVMDNRPY